LASSAKNVTDIYAVLLNELWQLALQNRQTTLIRVSDKASQRNNAHPLIQVVNGLKPPGTWFSVAQDIRNKCQHRDSTSTLISRVGRNAVPCINENLCPGRSELDRSLENFCPWLADQAYQFMEDVGTALSANPGL
jgi:hypothetical protein